MVVDGEKRRCRPVRALVNLGQIGIADVDRNAHLLGDHPSLRHRLAMRFASFNERPTRQRGIHENEIGRVSEIVLLLDNAAEAVLSQSQQRDNGKKK